MFDSNVESEPTQSLVLSKNRRPNISVARQFLSALDPRPDAVFTFQTFDDKKPARPHTARVIHSTEPNVMVTLGLMNAEGAGTFVTVNRTDGRGRAATNVVGLRALFIDHDAKHGEMKCPYSVTCPPSIVVESGGGVHAYWLLKENEPLDQFTEAQRSLAKYYGTDPAVSDLPRVMRVPGFFHNKEEPFLVRLVECIPDQRYTIHQILDAHGGTASVDLGIVSQRRDSPPADLQRILNECSWVRHTRDDAAHLSEPEWYAILGILGRCENGERHAHAFSEPHPGYDPDETREKLEHALDSAGPRTCQSIETAFGWTGCAQCPRRGQVKSPIVLGRARSLMTEADAVPVVEAALAALKNNPPDAGPLFLATTFEALASMREERRDQAIVRIKEILSGNRKAKDIVQMSLFNTRLRKAVAIAAKAARPVSANGLPTVLVEDQHLRDISDAAFRALVGANTPPTVMVNGGELVCVSISADGHAALVRFNHPKLKRRLSRVANWVTQSSIPTSPPDEVVQDLLHSREWDGILSISGITTVPILRTDGSFHTEPGLDNETGLYYQPPNGFELPDIPENPSDEQIKAAVRILYEPFKEFPFKDGASYANFIALIITLVVRPAIKGNIPLGVISANQPGTGKTRLATLSAIIAYGHDCMEVMAPTDDEEEMRKRITTKLKTGALIVTLDNVERRVNSPALCALLTSMFWSDRLLGGNDAIRTPNTAVWTVTGNNVRLGDDLIRRSYLILLYWASEHPEARVFEEDNIVAWVTEHRGELLASALLLVRAWYARGCPAAPNQKPFGSFEEWRTMIGGILNTAGIEGFLTNADQLQQANDGDSVQWGAFFRTWFTKYLDTPISVAQLCDETTLSRDALGGHDLFDTLPQHLAPAAQRGPGFLRHSLGNAFKGIVGTPKCGFILERVGSDKTANAVLWRVTVQDWDRVPCFLRAAQQTLQSLRGIGWFEAKPRHLELAVAAALSRDPHPMVEVPPGFDDVGWWLKRAGVSAKDIASVAVQIQALPKV